MKCSDYEVLISALADNELHGADRIEIEAHLNACKNCRQIYAETHSLQQDITSALLDCNDAPDLTQAITAKLSPKPKAVIRYIWAASAVLVFVILSLQVFVPGHVALNKRVVRKTHKDTYKVAEKNNRKHTPPAVNLIEKPIEHIAIKNYQHIRYVTAMHKTHKHINLQNAHVVAALKPSPISIDQAPEVTIEYLDETSPQIHTQLHDNELAGTPPIPGLNLNNKIVAVRDYITEDGNRIDMYYWVQVDSLNNNYSSNDTPKEP